MGWEGAFWYAKQTGDMKMNCWGSVEEEKLRFIQVERSTKGLTEVINNVPEFACFLSSGEFKSMVASTN
jgi:hypothetical protein